MKTLRTLVCALALTFAVATPPVLQTGCASPSERGVQVTTLKVLGASVDAAMKISGQLYQQGQITQVQAQEISNFHANRFQPAYRLAVAAVQTNLESYASPELMGLFQELSILIAKYKSQ